MFFRALALLFLWLVFCPLRLELHLLGILRPRMLQALAVARGACLCRDFPRFWLSSGGRRKQANSKKLKSKLAGAIWKFSFPVFAHFRRRVVRSPVGSYPELLLREAPALPRARGPPVDYFGDHSFSHARRRPKFLGGGAQSGLTGD